MWRFDATPRRIAALSGDAHAPSATAVEVRERRTIAGRRGSVVPDGQGARLELVVASGLNAPATVRAAVAPWLSARVSERLLNDAQLLLSELVTNSVLHARLARGASIRVSVEISDGLVHLEVEDPGDAVTAPRRPDLAYGGGFGLYLVETLAERWGSRHDGGTCVWAELAISNEGAHV
jgi:serine/threonine-protein kinase RsbW